MKTDKNRLYTTVFSAGMFFILMMSSLLAGHEGYCTERDNITAELNNALKLTINDRTSDIITPDTIRVYRQMQHRSDGKVLFALADSRFCNNIRNEKLRTNAYLTFDIVDDGYKAHDVCKGMLCSDTMIIDKECYGETIALRGYASLSAATIFRLSDQRMSAVLFMMSLAWAVMSALYIRRKYEEDEGMVRYGGLILSSEDNSFYTEDNTPVRFTPMQEQLMKMFLSSPSHSLSKEDICNALWPRKDDANDTLYTLIRRIKPVLEEKTSLKITSDRSKGYTLEIR